MAVSPGAVTNAADINDLADSTVGKPLVILLAQAAQSINSGASTAIAFAAGSELVDTHGYHDVTTNNTRVTPTKAGWYRCYGIVWFAGATTTTSLYAAIAKNGVQQNANRMKPASTAVAASGDVQATFSCDGSTEYIELNANQVDSGAAARLTTTGAATVCRLEVEFVRPL